MKHDEIQDLLYLYADDTLDDNQRSMVEIHLKGCGHCRRVMARYQTFCAGLAKVEPMKESSTFTVKVMEHLRESEKGEESNASPAETPGFFKWLFPAMGYMFGIVLMFAAIAYRELPSVSMETVLLSEVPQHTQWTFKAETPEINHWLGM